MKVTQGKNGRKRIVANKQSKQIADIKQRVRGLEQAEQARQGKPN